MRGVAREQRVHVDLRAQRENADNPDQWVTLDQWASKACLDHEDSQDHRGNEAYRERLVCQDRTVGLVLKEKEDHADHLAKLANKDLLAYLEHQDYLAQLGLEERWDHQERQEHKVCLFVFSRVFKFNECYGNQLLTNVVTFL